MVLYVSIAFNAILISLFVGKRIYYSNPASAPSNESIANEMWNKSRASVFDDSDIDSTDAVFVGDSQVEGFQFQKFLESMQKIGE